MVPHTVVVDFAVALLITSLACDLLAALAGEQELRTVAFWTLLFGTGAAALAVLSGFAAARVATPEGAALDLVHLHRNVAIATLACFLPVAALRIRSGKLPPERMATAYWLLAVSGLVLLVTAAYLGGSAVFRHGVGVATG